MTKTTALPGLSLKKHMGVWLIRHETSGLPMPGGDFAQKSDALTTLDQLAALDIDWTQSAEKVRAAIRAIPNGYSMVESICTPPEVRERRRRVHANAERHLRALQADGATVVKTTSYGLPGTQYQMSCGCERMYSVSVGFNAGDPSESLAPCHKHRGLSVPAVSTDIADIRRELDASAVTQ